MARRIRIGYQRAGPPPQYKPVYLMRQEGVADLDYQAAREAVNEVLDCAGVADNVSVLDLGVWRMDGYRNPDGSLAENRSVDWYIQKGREAGRPNQRGDTQLEGSVMLNLLDTEPWRFPDEGGTPHWDVLLVKDDLYTQKYDLNFMIGIASPQLSTVDSTYRFTALSNFTQPDDLYKFNSPQKGHVPITSEVVAHWSRAFADHRPADGKQLSFGDYLRRECMKTEVMHEVGHVFGLVPDSRKEADERIGLHCKDVCTMRQGITVPTDWIRNTGDRLSHGPFCAHCTSDLREFFTRENQLKRLE